MKLFILPLLISVLIMSLPVLLRANPLKNGSLPDSPTQRSREAVESLIRLQHAIKSEGFFCARVALNVWRCTATEAGVFDETKYNDYKRRIYNTSIENSLRCYKSALSKKNYHDARICLHTWSAHSKELGTFDPEIFEELSNALKR